MEQAVIDITYYLLHDVFQFISYFLVLSYFLTPKCSRAIVVLLPVIVGLSPPIFPLLYDDNVSFFLLIFMLTVTALAGFEEKPIICICAIVTEIAVFTMLSLVSAMIGFFILGYYPTNLVPTTWVSVVFT